MRNEPLSEAVNDRCEKLASHDEGNAPSRVLWKDAVDGRARSRRMTTGIVASSDFRR
jgi:hypothetical protein